MKLTKWFYILIIWTLLIWTQSLLSGDISSGQSSFITTIATQILSFINISIDYDLLHTLIRKTAHFTEYAVLAVFWLLCLKNIVDNDYQKILYVLLGVLVTAAIDEAIQLLHVDRTTSFYDVLIDFCGGLLIILVFLSHKVVYNRHVKNLKEIKE